MSIPLKLQFKVLTKENKGNSRSIITLKITTDIYKLSDFWDFPNLKELRANNKFYNTLLLLSNLT
jgi:hypothetical protein